MNRSRVASIILLALGLLSLPAPGQDPSQTPSQSKKPPVFVVEEGDDEKLMRGFEVADPPAQVRIIKEYPIDFQGPQALGVTLSVPKVVYYSDGRMRWYFSFWNRSKEGQTFYFDFEDSFIADADSHPYPQLARHVINGNRGSIFMKTITSDRRFETWIDVKAPERPTSKFKVGVMLEGRRDHRADAYKPFVVDLTEPLPPIISKPKVAREKRLEAGVDERPDEFDAVRQGRMAGMEEPESPPRPSIAATEAVKAASTDGRRYTGTIQGPEGGLERGGILFERRSDSRLLSATIFRNTQPLKDIRLIGDYHERRSAPGGLIVRFEDFKKVEYTFTIDKNNLKGRDTEGNIYSLVFVRE